MAKINLNLDSFISKTEKIVATHRLGKGDYARWLWQNKKADREMGSNPYGVADAANILYTIGALPQDEGEREGFIKALRGFQDPESGLFHEATHHTYHTTAHCTAALELFDKYPLYPFTELKQYDDPDALRAFLDSLDWVNNAWTISHRGAGVFAAKIIAERPSLEWQDAYFGYLEENCDEKYGMGYKGAIDESILPTNHHLNGWFHYMFNFNHCHRQFPHTKTFIDTLIKLYTDGYPEKERFGRMIGFREVDWVFPINRATWQVGYRREEARELMRDFAVKYVEFLESLNPDTDDALNDLHALFGTVCCLSELQLALPGEIRTTRPMKNVLDRRPFI